MYNKQKEIRKMMCIKKLLELKKTRRSSSSFSKKTDATVIDTNDLTYRYAVFWKTAAVGRKKFNRKQQRRTIQHRTQHQKRTQPQLKEDVTELSTIHSTKTRRIINDNGNRSNSLTTEFQKSTEQSIRSCNVLDREGLFGEFIHDGDSDDNLNDAEDTLYWAGLQGLS